MAFTPPAKYATTGSVFDTSTFGLGSLTLDDGVTVAESRSVTATTVRSDSVTASESRTVSMSITRTDGVSIADIIASIGWTFSDAVSLSEARTMSFTKANTDGIVLSEADVKAVSQALTDSVTISEVRTIEFSSSWADVSTIAEALSKHLSATGFTDSVTVASVIGVNAVKWTVRTARTTTWTDVATGGSIFTSAAHASTTWTNPINPPVQDPPEEL